MIVYGGVWMEVAIKDTACVFKALADENRLRILLLLASGEKCACKLLEEIQVTQPTMSHHMKILCDAGLVVGRKEGKWMHYSISQEKVAEISAYFDFLMMRQGAVLANDGSCCKH